MPLGMGQRAQSTAPQRPAAQISIPEALQAVEQDPQWTASFRRSTQAPSQQVMSPPHDAGHEPPESFSPGIASPVFAPDVPASVRGGAP